MPHACVGSECMASAALPASTRKMSLRMRWPGRVRHFLLSPERDSLFGKVPGRADEERVGACAPKHRETLRAVPSPQPFSRWERGWRYSFSHRENVPRRGG